MSYRVGNVDVLQSHAHAKRIITNMSYGVGNMDALQSLAAVKRIITNMG